MSDGYKAAEQAMLTEAVADADIVITTALIPNRPAPTLVKAETVARMRRGSVIVDLAAQNGGNVEGVPPPSLRSSGGGGVGHSNRVLASD